jgi:hypothetical protein
MVEETLYENVTAIFTVSIQFDEPSRQSAICCHSTAARESISIYQLQRQDTSTMSSFAIMHSHLWKIAFSFEQSTNRKPQKKKKNETRDECRDEFVVFKDTNETQVFINGSNLVSCQRLFYAAGETPSSAPAAAKAAAAMPAGGWLNAHTAYTYNHLCASHARPCMGLTKQPAIAYELDHPRWPHLSLIAWRVIRLSGAILCVFSTSPSSLGNCSALASPRRHSSMTYLRMVNGQRIGPSVKSSPQTVARYIMSSGPSRIRGTAVSGSSSSSS